MKVISSDEMRRLDKRAAADFKLAGEVLMDRAGYATAELVQFLGKAAGFDGAVVQLFAGRGNNGGDVFAAARHLKEFGIPCEVWLAGDTKAVGGDAMAHLSRMKAAGITLHELPTKQDWDDAIASCRVPPGIIVDGVLGTGVTGPARGPADGAIRFINSLAARGMIVSIDVPSGLDADTGEAEGNVVCADLTLTMGMPKRGLLEPAALNYVGCVDVADIGLPEELTGEIQSDIEMITVEDVRRMLPRRARTAHKGMFGHVLVIGGARSYSGAVAMAAKAALRSGAGLVSVLAPAGIANIVATVVPEAMVHAAPENSTGSLTANCIETWARKFNDFDAILVGPGLTAHDDSRALVRTLLRQCRKPLVIDADGINALTGLYDAIRSADCPVVLTPHPGEMARLLNMTIEAVQSNRFKTAQTAVEKTGATVILKGAGTVVATKGQPLNINMTGNPGMASGGMGDILSGMVAGMCAQGIPIFDAARSSVYLHGRAGDSVAWHTSQAGMIATDVLQELASIFREALPR